MKSSHNKSKSLISKIQHIQNNQLHQRNLQKIYNRNRPLQKNTNNQLEYGSFLDDYDLHLCLQSLESKNIGNFLTGHQIHSCKNQSNYQEKQKIKKLETENQFIVNKLSNIVSSLRGFNTGRVNTEGNQKFGGRRSHRVKSSAEINRNREHIRIEKQNLQIKNRIISAMNTSKYSQAKIKNYEHYHTFNRTLTNDKKHTKTQFAKSQPKQTQIQKQSLNHIHTQIKSDRQQIIPVQSNFKIHNHIRNKTSEHIPKQFQRSSKVTSRQHTKTRTSCRIQNQIEYVLLDQYKISSTSEARNSSFSYAKQQNTNKVNEQFQRTKRAAVLHYKKLQKMRNTESRLWQIFPQNNERK